MQNFTFTVKDPNGFHARPVGMLVNRAKTFPCIICVQKENVSVEATKMFGLLNLGIKKGDTIIITTDGEQEVEAAAALKDFLNENL